MFEQGDIVRVPLDHETTIWRGAELEIIQPSAATNNARVRMANGAARPDGYEGSPFYWSLDHMEALPLPNDASEEDPDFEPKDYDDLMQKLREADSANDALRRQVQDLTDDISDANRKFNDQVSRHVADINLIGQRLMSEADDRNWCDEYDAIIARLNSELSILLPVRKREYEVELEITYRVGVTVEAAAEEDAREEAERLFSEDPSDYFQANEPYMVSQGQCRDNGRNQF